MLNTPYILLGLLSLLSPASASPAQQHVECIFSTRDHFTPAAKNIGLNSSCILSQSSFKNGYGPGPGQNLTEHTVTPSTVTPDNLLLLNGLVELGCFNELPGTSLNYAPSFHETIESCTAWARGHKYNYIGLSRGGVCSGTNNLTALTHPGPVHTYDCSLSCTSDPGNVCGGHFAVRSFFVGPDRIAMTVNIMADNVSSGLPPQLFLIGPNGTDLTGLGHNAYSVNPTNSPYISFSSHPPPLNFTINITNTAAYPQSYIGLTNFTMPVNYSKSIWAYYDGKAPIPSAANLISSSTQTNQLHYMWLDNGAISAGHSSSGQVIVTVRDSITYPTGVWTHYVVTYTQTTQTMKLYRNGTLISTGQPGGWSGGSDACIGAFLQSYQWSGSLAYASVYNGTLNATQVQALFQSEGTYVIPVVNPPPPTQQLTGNGIIYHGGPILPPVPNVYLIWYGNWTGNSAISIITNFVHTLGGSNWWNIETTYYQNISGVLTHVAPTFNYIGSATDSYSRGSNLQTSDIYYSVQGIINGKSLPLDSNGVYLVLTSADVVLNGFCTQYCGWHTYAGMSSTTVIYGTIGNPITQCPSACMAQGTGPNGNAGADAMISIIAHEIAESVADPTFMAWLDSNNNEDADKCAWTFGTTYSTANGAQANVNIAGVNYLVQQNWVNDRGGYCALSYP